MLFKLRSKCMKKIVGILSLIFITSSSVANDITSAKYIPNDVKSITAVIQIYSQVLVFKLPKTWKPAYKAENANTFLAEFIPKNEDINSWKTILSIQGFKNLADKLTPAELLDKVAAGFKSTCGNNVIYKKLGPKYISGYKAYTAILGCTRFPVSTPTGAKQGQSEIGYYLSIQGEKDFYFIHKSIRDKGFSPSSSPLNKENAPAFIADITPIKLVKKPIT